MPSVEDKHRRIVEIKRRLDEIAADSEAIHGDDGSLRLVRAHKHEFKALIVEAQQLRSDLDAAEDRRAYVELLDALQAEHDRIVDAALLNGGRTYTQADAERLAVLDAEAAALRGMLDAHDEKAERVATERTQAREERHARRTWEAARTDEEKARAALLDARRTFILAWRRRQRRKLFHLALTLPAGLAVLGWLAAGPPGVWLLAAFAGGLVGTFLGTPLGAMLRRRLRRRRATLRKANAAHAAFLSRRSEWRNAWELRMRAEAELPLHVLYPEIFLDVWAESRR